MSSSFANAVPKICRPLLAALGMLWVAVAPLRADTELRWKFREGDDSRYTLSTVTNQEMSVNEQKIKMSIEQIFDQTWKIGAVKPDGTATVSQITDRIRMSMSSGAGDQTQSSKYDSDNKEKPSDMFGASMVKLLGPMIGKAVTMEISPLGKISNYKAAPGMFAGVKDAPGLEQMGGMFSEDGMKQIMEQTMLKFPPEKIAKGTKWDASFEMPNPLGKQKVATTYTYAGPEKVDGKELEKIDLTIDTSIELPKDAPAKIEIKDQKSAGAMYFDNTAGRLQKSENTTSMKMEVIAEGMKVEVDSQVKTLYLRHDVKKSSS